MPDVPTKPSIGAALPSVKYPLLLTVLQAIAAGATPRQACLDQGVTLATLRYHVKQDDELRALFDEALDTGSDALADMLVDIDKVHSNPAMANVISKNIQWLLERRKPDKFGARMQVSMENHATTGLLKALDMAIQRIPMATAPQVADRRVVDVEYVEVKEKAASGETPPETQSGSREEDLRLLGLL